MTKEKFKFLEVGSIVITNGTCRQNAGIKCVVTYICEDRIWIKPIDGQKFTSSDNWCSEDWNEVSYKSVSLFVRNRGFRPSFLFRKDNDISHANLARPLMKETSINFLKGESTMSEVRNQTRRYMDIGRAHKLLKEGKSEAEVYEDFETRYNRHKENPWWGDKAPDVVFSHILEIIKKAEEKKKEMK